MNEIDIVKSDLTGGPVIYLGLISRRTQSLLVQSKTQEYPHYI